MFNPNIVIEPSALTLIPESGINCSPLFGRLTPGSRLGRPFFLLLTPVVIRLRVFWRGGKEGIEPCNIEFAPKQLDAAAPAPLYFPKLRCPDGSPLGHDSVKVPFLWAVAPCQLRNSNMIHRSDG